MDQEVFNITFLIIVLTSISSYQAIENPILKQKFLFRPTAIQERGEWLRFLTHGLIHADWMHLILNMYVLYIFGIKVEAEFIEIFGATEGLILYVLLYVLGLIASSIPSYLKHQGNSTYSALGASGAVSGILFAFIFFEPWKLLYLFFFVPLPALFLGIGYLWYSDYMAKQNRDNIGHDAHFWGGVFGFLFIVVIMLVNAPEYISEFLGKLYNGLLITNHMH